ncbi:uncharacterized protein MYCFIDRAFT_187864 [Pseudocercospora fijiensis CIRAD86]|uniref:catechol O-methyltransferase n=1 Tax=Pseudocercospora fijiensis (strain CIRAD86) TaxID=383855 RepID=M3AKR3_PSEFD|nr:uncharacterized protein MYCFIDRAFT_187864 [Pseudocercospora fijiensis CIRAD86]EME85166.1 hypothetical protein MYCFIDRAFT_187864 [Pseudocercospora fijiensis CIRAD86]
MQQQDFDESKAYQQQGPVDFDDGRELELLNFVYSRPNIDEIRNSPQKVLQAIDEFGRTRKYLMNVGEFKGRTVELGGYVGYSAILFAEALRKVGGQKYYSLERNPEFAAVLLALVDLAGLSDIVKVEVGSSDASIQRLHSSGHLQHIDMLFLDHWKPAYVTDLKLCEELRLIKPGSILVADNVISPGNPPYLEYVRSTVAEKREKARTPQGADAIQGLFSPKQVELYKNRVPNGELADSIGNPSLVYESELIEGFEPTGEADALEVSRCIREETLLNE